MEASETGAHAGMSGLLSGIAFAQAFDLQPARAVADQTDGGFSFSNAQPSSVGIPVRQSHGTA